MESIGPASVVLYNCLLSAGPALVKATPWTHQCLPHKDFKVRVTEITTDSQINCLFPLHCPQSFFKPPPRLFSFSPRLLFLSSSPLLFKSVPLSGRVKARAINKAYYGLLT